MDYEGRKASCSADIISRSSTSARMSAREQISLTKTDSEDLGNKTQDCSSTAARMEASGGNNSNSHDQRELENKIQECGSTSARMDARGWSRLLKNDSVDIENKPQAYSGTSARMDAREQINLINPVPRGIGVTMMSSESAEGEISWASLGARPKSLGKVRNQVGAKSNSSGGGSRGRGRATRSRKARVDEQQPLITGLLTPGRKVREDITKRDQNLD